MTSKWVAVRSQGPALAPGVDAASFGDACRAAGLAFLRGAAAGWSKRELAVWLLGPYRAVSLRPAPKLVLALDDEDDDDSTDDPSSSGVRASAVEDLVELVRVAVGCTLAELRQGETSAVTLAIREGRVACGSNADGSRVVWIPLDQPRMRLEGRVVSLFVADYLTRPEAYEHDLSVCPGCDGVSFDPTPPPCCGTRSTWRRMPVVAAAR